MFSQLLCGVVNEQEECEGMTNITKIVFYFILQAHFRMLIIASASQLYLNDLQNATYFFTHFEEHESDGW